MTRVLKYLKPVIFEIILVFIFLTGQVIFQLLIPDQTKNMSTYIAEMSTSDKGSALYNQAFMSLWKMGGIMLLYVLGFVICAVIVSFAISRISTIFAQEMRKDVFKKVTSVSLTSFNSIGVSSLITRTTNDITQVQQAILMTVRIIVQAPITLGVALFMIFFKYDPTMAYILLVTIPLLVAVVLFILFKAMPLVKSNQKKIDKTTLVLRENLTGVRVIRAFDKQEYETERFDKTNRDLTGVNIKSNRFFSILMPSITLIMNLSFIGVYLIGIYSFNGVLFLDAMKNLSSVLPVSQYIMQIMLSFMMFAMIFVFIPRASVSLQRIVSILDLPVADEDIQMDEETIKQLNSSKGTLEFKNVSFQFADSQEPTLCNISFKAEPNKTTAIIGSTGSGKSTIVNLIPRFYDATQGEILVNGVNIKKISGEEIRKRISFVPQKALLFKGTIKENLKYGNEEASDEDLISALKTAESYNFVMDKEGQLDASVSQGGSNFSGGQKQRLCIARALVRKGEIYVFDDSFSALDFKTDVKVRTNLTEYTKGSTIIIVGQRIASIMDADNIVVLDDGKVVGQGTHSELLANNKVYQEIVKSQLDASEIETTLKMKKDIKEAI